MVSGNQTQVVLPADISWASVEDEAVAIALADFAQYQAALDIGEEEFEIQPSGFALEAAKTLGTPDAMEQLKQANEKGRSEFDQYLYEEQSALVEGLVRAYARRRLRPLLEQYEVLEVEREGSWLLSEWRDASPVRDAGSDLHGNAYELWFMS